MPMCLRYTPKVSLLTAPRYGFHPIAQRILPLPPDEIERTWRADGTSIKSLWRKLDWIPICNFLTSFGQCSVAAIGIAMRKYSLKYELQRWGEVNSTNGWQVHQKWFHRLQTERVDNESHDSTVPWPRSSFAVSLPRTCHSRPSRLDWEFSSLFPYCPLSHLSSVTMTRTSHAQHTAIHQTHVHQPHVPMQQYPKETCYPFEY